MALTRANATTAISGTIAASSVANATVANISALPSGIQGGALTLLSTQTASASASISFTSGIDSTYDSYVFKFIDIHPATDDVDFTFNFSTDSGSNYNVTKTTTYIWTYHYENDSNAEILYETGSDLAQGTGFQKFARRMGNAADESQSGTLQIFNPSSTTFVKHFIADAASHYAPIDGTQRALVAGYGNTTSAIDAIQFKMSSGNFDGIIKMYGVS